MKLPTVDATTWGELIDTTSGNLSRETKDAITQASGTTDIANLFGEFLTMQNRNVHSFRITNTDGEQSLQTKEKNGQQFEITADYLKDFIKKNEELSLNLNKFRNELRK